MAKNDWILDVKVSKKLSHQNSGGVMKGGKKIWVGGGRIGGGESACIQT